MVMPKFPFSLFDFKNITKFDIKHYKADAAAGVQLDAVMYVCPDHKIALLLFLSINATKTTPTNLLVHIARVYETPPEEVWYQDLLSEDVGTASASWPSGKAAASNVCGWHLCFLFPGDGILVRHALTVAETIAHLGVYHIIEYNDPRYEK